MAQNLTEKDFETLSWHDNIVYGLRFDVGDSSQGDWRSDLVLDIDHIVEWICGTGGLPSVPLREAGVAQFRVAPASLIFHHVTDLDIGLNFGDSGHRTAMNEPSIDAITRQRIKDQKICLDRPYYRWRIAFNLPPGGEIGFGASGFSMELRADPVLTDEQRLSPADRA